MAKRLRCTYCRREFNPALRPTRDHVVPKSKGGERTVLACNTCNNIKADMMPAEWTEYMARHPEWWRTDRVVLTLREMSNRANASTDPRIATTNRGPRPTASPLVQHPILQHRALRER